VGALAGLAAFAYGKLADWVDDYGKRSIERKNAEIEAELVAVEKALESDDPKAAQAALLKLNEINSQGVATPEKAAEIAKKAEEVAATLQDAGKDTTGQSGAEVRNALTEEFRKKRNPTQGSTDEQQELAFEFMQRMVKGGLAKDLEAAGYFLLGKNDLLRSKVMENLEELQQESLPPEMRSSPDTSTPADEPTTTPRLTPQDQRKANRLATEEAKKQKLLSQSVGENLERLEKFKENSTSAPIIVPVPLPSGGPPGTGAPVSSVVNHTTVIQKTDTASSLNSAKNQPMSRGNMGR